MSKLTNCKRWPFKPEVGQTVIHNVNDRYKVVGVNGYMVALLAVK